MQTRPLTEPSVTSLLPSVDWGSTCAGPESQWPQSLRTALSICLDSRFPIVIFWGPDLVQLYNDAYATAILREKHPALGVRAQDCWAEIWPVIGPLLDTVMNDGRATYSEDLYLPILTKGVAEERYFTFSYSPIRTEQGIGGVFCAVTETTARILREREAAERAEALAELDRAKTDFFSNVSHEFRTPLTLILGPLEQLLKREREPGELEELETIRRNALRLFKLVNALLQFTTDGSRDQANFERVDIAALTAELASVFRSTIESAGLRYVIDVPPTELPAYVDPAKWEKIVFNLLSNALKFTFAGEIRVCVRSTDGDVVLEVSDTGAGVPADSLPKLFQRFERVRGTRSRTHEGTGIGLALVKELAAAHGGTVAAASIADRGSTFSVTIPRGDAHLPSEQIVPPLHVRVAGDIAQRYLAEAAVWTQAPAAAPVQVAGKPRILVVDDNADLRNYLTRLLSERYTVHAVEDGKAAIDAETPDLILSDVMMPEIDGLEFVRAVRSSEKVQGIPIILLSARAGEESALAGLRAGADDYLVKPFTAQALFAHVETHLNNASIRERKAEKLRERTERDSRIADAMQAASLPARLPQIPGLRFDAIYLPALAEARIGGDWYDAMRLADGRVVISIGDVAGSSLKAAITMSNMRQVIRGIAQVYADPVLMLNAADKALRIEEPECFVTAFVAVLDPSTMMLTYASAGHPPPVLRSRDGRVHELDHVGLPLGLRDDGHAPSATMHLPDDCVLILYTDGLTEVDKRPSEGFANLKARLQSEQLFCAENPARALQEALLPNGSHDDVAIMSLRVRANPRLSRQSNGRSKDGVAI